MSTENQAPENDPTLDADGKPYVHSVLDDGWVNPDGD